MGELSKLPNIAAKLESQLADVGIPSLPKKAQKHRKSSKVQSLPALRAEKSCARKALLYQRLTATEIQYQSRAKASLPLRSATK